MAEQKVLKTKKISSSHRKAKPPAVVAVITNTAPPSQRKKEKKAKKRAIEPDASDLKPSHVEQTVRSTEGNGNRIHASTLDTQTHDASITFNSSTSSATSSSVLYSELLELVESFLTAYGFEATVRKLQGEQRKRPKLHRTAPSEPLNSPESSLLHFYREWRSKKDSKHATTGTVKPEVIFNKDALETNGSALTKSATTSSSSNGDSDPQTVPASLQTASTNGQQPQVKAKSLKRKAGAMNPTHELSSHSTPADPTAVETTTRPVKKAKTKAAKSKKPTTSASAQTTGTAISPDNVASQTAQQDATTEARIEKSLEGKSTSTLSVQNAAPDPSSISTDSPSLIHPSRQRAYGSPVVRFAVHNNALKSSNMHGSQPAEASFAASGVNGAIKHKSNVPFQRISADAKVDPRFSSNAYVPNDYAEQAHRDLVVTKGKGFTKEKNKKKRGSYRGGMIDMTGGKGVKFVD